MKNPNEFADQMTNMQLGIAKLCMEFAQDEAEEIYIYICMEEKQSAFDAFFTVDGKLIKKEELARTKGYPLKIIEKFLVLGMGNVQKFREYAQKANRKFPFKKAEPPKLPTEIRGYYSDREGGYRAQLKYEKVCGPDTGIKPGDVVDAWFEEVKREKELGRVN